MGRLQLLNCSCQGGIVIDTNDNVYITCSPVPAVRKIDAVTGIINTFAGTGTPGYSGDGAAATAALISGPTGITLDSIGNVYFSDYNNHCIRKVTPAGIITTCAGTGTVSGYSGDGGAATMAKMYRPTDVAVKNGSLYIVDNWNNCIRVVNAAGTISTYAGDTASGYSGDGGPATAARLSRPFSIDANNLGDVFVSDLNNSCVRKITNVSSLATPEIFTSDRALVVYPNPFQSEITITVKSIKSEAEVSVYLINAIGQNFRSTTALLKNGSLRVDLTDIPSGIYMLFVENPNTGTVLKQKIIKL